MGSRSEEHRRMAREEYLANAKAILDFCKSVGVSDRNALAFSTVTIDFKDFVWFHGRANGKVGKLRRMLATRAAKIEYNRQMSRLLLDNGQGDQDDENNAKRKCRL